MVGIGQYLNCIQPNNMYMIYVVLRALWKIDEYLISTLYYYYNGQLVVMFFLTIKYSYLLQSRPCTDLQKI